MFPDGSSLTVARYGILGTSFPSGSRISFGGVLATEVSFISSTNATAVTEASNSAR